MLLRFSALLLPAVLLLTTPALADGPATAEVSPQAAYKAKAAGVSRAPAREHAFRFDGVLRINGKRVGHVLLGSRPDWRGGEG